MAESDRPAPDRSSLRRPFLGRGWGFPPSFDKATGEIRMVQEEEDIRQSLRILFTTIRGERIMRPEYGSDLHEHVFGGTDDTTLYRIRAKIAEAILDFEPRILVERIDIDRDQIVDGRLLIDIAYFIPSTNSRSNLVFPFYTREATSVNLG